MPPKPKAEAHPINRVGQTPPSEILTALIRRGFKNPERDGRLQVYFIRPAQEGQRLSSLLNALPMELSDLLPKCTVMHENSHGLILVDTGHGTESTFANGNIIDLTGVLTAPSTAVAVTFCVPDGHGMDGQEIVLYLGAAKVDFEAWTDVRIRPGMFSVDLSPIPAVPLVKEPGPALQPQHIKRLFFQMDPRKYRIEYEDGTVQELPEGDIVNLSKPDFERLKVASDAANDFTPKFGSA